MIGIINGKILEKEPDLIVGVNGIGFLITVSQTTKMKLPAVGTQCLIHTFVKYTRDELPQIYGFLRKDEKEFFKMLLSVSGIGPKVSLNLLDVFSPAKIAAIISSGRARELCVVSGLGEKGAKRIIVDLKDKIKKIDIVPEGGEFSPVYKDACDALMALGWNAAVSRTAVEEVIRENPEMSDAAEVVKIAFAKLGKTRK
ncbi:MAG: Holliday junction branch migration protein RuvA [Elusimicrobia bacterium]|nr:Holliday junction branch migration protein RuvA [Elusimicrobiota bacterium]